MSHHWLASIFPLKMEDGLVFGLKGRFCQPRPQAWVRRPEAINAL